MSEENRPWQNKEWLKKRYVDQNMKRHEIADEVGCCDMTITRWKDRHGLVKLHRQESWLREKYEEERLRIQEMAELANTHRANISRYMNKHGIERRDASNRPATFNVGSKGYEFWTCGVNHDYVKVHRLVAVAEYGFDAVCGMEVHHKNGYRRDNRPENLEVKSHKEHRAAHRKYSWLDEIRIRELYRSSDLSSSDIGEMFGVSGSTVIHIVNGTGNSRYSELDTAKDRAGLSD